MNCLMNTYHGLPAVFCRGAGSYLYDTNGKEYLDFTSGIAVNCLGHAHPALVNAVSKQAAALMHVSNYYNSDVQLKLAQRLVGACSASGLKNAFLCNSGAEANEGAIKTARKYSFDKYGKGRHTIVTLKNSFHGRTITTLAATGQDRFHTSFNPFTEGFVYIDANDTSALDKALDKNTTAALLIEIIQGEGGVIPLSDSFVAAAAALCAERDILLVCDEIQCGLGRSGTFLACEHFGIKPDLVTLAKGLAGGIPMGAFLAGEKTAATLGPGDHGSTFGGNPLACAASLAVLDIILADGFLAGIKASGETFMDGLAKLASPLIREIRGRGLIIGAQLSENADAWRIVEKCFEKGLLILSAGGNTLRFLPPYTISGSEIARGLEILGSVL